MNHKKKERMEGRKEQSREIWLTAKKENETMRTLMTKKSVKVIKIILKQKSFKKNGKTR